MLTISYAGYLSWSVSSDRSAQFTLEIFVAAETQAKILKTFIFEVQGRSRSSMLVPTESSSAVLVLINSKSVSSCCCSHAKRANNGKITISKGGGCPLLMPSLEENFLTQRHEICSQETRDSTLSYGKSPESL